MAPTFNLLDEPWIWVTCLDGSPAEVSLLGVFQQAESLKGVHGEIATQDIAILRLLLAICHRAMDGPADQAVWEDYWDEPARLGQDATAYLERFRDRFDLRHPEQPFFQVAGIHAASGKVSGLETLVVDVPNGEPFFATRAGAGLERLSWAEAARWLVHVHAFDPSGIRSGAVGDPAVKGGKGYPIGPGWTGQIGTVVVQGSSLLQTLLLNTVATDEVPALSKVDPERDLPPWERTPDGPAGRSAAEPSGPVTCYTWQTRRVLLHGSDDGVTGLFLGNGDKATPQNRFSVEPMSAWRFSEPQTKKLGAPTFMPRKLPTDQALWRGLSSLVAQMSPTQSVKEAGEVTSFQSPGVVQQYQRLMATGLVPHTGLVPLHAVGLEYGAQEAVVTELVDDVLVLPRGLLDPDSQQLVPVVRDAMEQTKQVAACLRNLAANLDRARGGSPDTAAVARDRASTAFYLVIDQEFPRWLASLAEVEPQAARSRWRAHLRTEAWRQHEVLAGAVPSTAFVGRGDGTGRMDVSRALFFFRQGLRKALPPTPPSSNHTDHEHERTQA